MDIYHERVKSKMFQVECVRCGATFTSRGKAQLSNILNAHTMREHRGYQGRPFVEVPIELDEFWTRCCGGVYRAATREKLVSNFYLHRRTGKHREQRRFDEWNKAREPDRVIELVGIPTSEAVRIRMGLPPLPQEIWKPSA